MSSTLDVLSSFFRCASDAIFVATEMADVAATLWAIDPVPAPAHMRMKRSISSDRW